MPLRQHVSHELSHVLVESRDSLRACGFHVETHVGDRRAAAHVCRALEVRARESCDRVSVSPRRACAFRAEEHDVVRKLHVFADSGELTIYGDTYVAPVGAAIAGASLALSECTGAAEQKFAVNADLTISSLAAPELCLATAESEWSLALAPCDASLATQQWTRS